MGSLSKGIKMDYLLLITGLAFANFSFQKWIDERKDYRKAAEITLQQAVAVGAAWLICVIL